MCHYPSEDCFVVARPQSPVVNRLDPEGILENYEFIVVRRNPETGEETELSKLFDLQSALTALEGIRYALMQLGAGHFELRK